MAANVLQFVETPITAPTPRLVLDYIEEGTSIPLPSHTKIWAANSTADGANYIDGKYELIPITLSLKVRAASAAALDTALRAVITEITRENWLEFHPDGGSHIFYHTYPYDTAEAQAVMNRAQRAAFLTYEFTITLMADPFAVGPEETLTVLENLLPNPGFVNWTGADIDDWTIFTDVGSGAATVTKDTTNVTVDGYGAAIHTTAADAIARITTTDFIPITNTKHYCMSFFYYASGGARDELDCIIRQYNNAGADLADDITIDTASPFGAGMHQAWQAIHPAGEGGVDWHADCVKVKVIFEIDSDTGGPSTVDYAIFCMSDYLSENLYNAPQGVVIPGSAISGDIPAPVNVYLDKWEDVTMTDVGTYLGQRAEYDDNYIPAMTPDTGLNSWGLIQGVYSGEFRRVLLPANLLSGPSFDALATGTAGSNTETWTGWTVDRATHWTMIASTAAPYYSTYCVYCQRYDAGAGTPTMTSAFTAVTAANGHRFSMWYKLNNWSGQAYLKVEVVCYDVGSGETGRFTVGTFRASKSAWTEMFYYINGTGGAAPAFPAGTTKVKILITPYMYRKGSWVSGYHQSNNDWCDFDQACLEEAEYTVGFHGSIPLSSAFGKVKPILHFYIEDAFSDKILSLKGVISDDALGDICDEDELETVTAGTLPEDDFDYVGDGLFSPLALPSRSLADDAVITTLNQELTIMVDPLLNTNGIDFGELVLLPVDGGLATVPAAGDVEHIVFDSRSSFPTVRKSLDGSLDTAAYLAGATLRRRFTLSSGEGVNLCLLQMWLDPSGDKLGMPLTDITLKYTPRYLLVK